VLTSMHSKRLSSVLFTPSMAARCTTASTFLAAIAIDHLSIIVPVRSSSSPFFSEPLQLRFSTHELLRQIEAKHGVAVIKQLPCQRKPYHPSATSNQNSACHQCSQYPLSSVFLTSDNTNHLSGVRTPRPPYDEFPPRAQPSLRIPAHFWLSARRRQTPGYRRVATAQIAVLSRILGNPDQSESAG